MSEPTLLAAGPWAGWRTWPKDTFETGTGPFYSRTDEQGRVVSAFIAEPRHMNGGGFMHGGCLLTFADYHCFAMAHGVTGGPAVTVNLSGDFLSSASVGERMEATGEVTRAGGRLIYVRGMITADARPCLSFTSVITRIKPRTTG
ncbi:MAG: PaaI family thioesterase [Alphaproteobacteria bacterium]|nr:PaaI family thioesterase [Alphaproteobacteria bacterium]